MKAEMLEDQGDLQFDVAWTSLGEYLEHVAERGVSPNVASFVGATTVRIHELGYENRAPSPEELERMSLNFYGFDPSYHVARYKFVHKIAKSRTPATIARHRQGPGDLRNAS